MILTVHNGIIRNAVLDTWPNEECKFSCMNLISCSVTMSGKFDTPIFVDCFFLDCTISFEDASAMAKCVIKNSPSKEKK